MRGTQAQLGRAMYDFDAPIHLCQFICNLSRAIRRVVINDDNLGDVTEGLP